MKAIETKYHGPTDSKGARISASDMDNNRVYISYPHELSGADCHEVAARALAKKMGWTGDMIGGATKTGYAWVFVPGSWKVDRDIQAKRLKARGVEV